MGLPGDVERMHNYVAANLAAIRDYRLFTVPVECSKGNANALKKRDFDSFQASRLREMEIFLLTPRMLGSYAACTWTLLCMNVSALSQPRNTRIQYD